MGQQLQGMEMPPNLTLFHVGVEGRENICVETVSTSHLLLALIKRSPYRRLYGITANAITRPCE